jgi:hypothetical protein
MEAMQRQLQVERQKKENLSLLFEQKLRTCRNENERLTALLQNECEGSRLLKEEKTLVETNFEAHLMLVNAKGQTRQGH